MAKQSTTTTTRQAKSPDFIAYVVTKRDGQDKGFWNAIGAAWNNKDGDGLNIHLNALPLTGEIVLRRPKADE